jgi:hypothetical protein
MKLNEIFIEQYRIIKNNNPHVPFGSNLEIAKENTIGSYLLRLTR